MGNQKTEILNSKQELDHVLVTFTLLLFHTGVNKENELIFVNHRHWRKLICCYRRTSFVFQLANEIEANLKMQSQTIKKLSANKLQVF